MHHVDGREGVERSSVAWLVGCDGARSVVRKISGLSFLGETKDDHDMLIGEIKVKGEPRQVISSIRLNAVLKLIV